MKTNVVGEITTCGIYEISSTLLEDRITEATLIRLHIEDWIPVVTIRRFFNLAKL